MKNIPLSKRAFELLIASLIKLDESQTDTLDSCFSCPLEAREDYSLITNYINRMNTILERVLVLDSCQIDQFPFVVTGSTIIVEGIETQSCSEFHLITPSEQPVVKGDIAILSPIGRALLLNEINSIVEFDTLGGALHYRILSINLRARDAGE